MSTGKSYKSSMKEAKQRLIYLYLPSLEKRDELKILADKARMPLSKFIVEHVENSLKQEQDKEEFTSRLNLMNDLKKIKEENNDLHKKIKMLETLVNRLEEELRWYRLKPFLEEEFSGVRKYEVELIKLFKTRVEVRKEEILEYLGVDPLDTETVRGILKQIENLEGYGLLKDIGGKWRWKS
jgi:hypothetical protein